MAPVCIIYSIWDMLYYHKALKELFGNRKNYMRYIEAARWNQWNQWLISLGYIKE